MLQALTRTSAIQYNYSLVPNSIKQKILLQKNYKTKDFSFVFDNYY